MVNGRLYSRILKRRLEAVNLEPIFKFWPNLIMTHYKKNFQKVVTSFNDITKTGYFLLKFPTSSNWPKSLGNQSSRASWISTKFGIWITNTCGNVIEGFKNFQLLYGANQEVKKSKNNLNAIFWLFFYIYIYILELEVCLITTKADRQVEHDTICLNPLTKFYYDIH